MAIAGYLPAPGKRDLDCVEYFSGKGVIFSTYNERNYKGEGFDIANNNNAENLMTPLGFAIALWKAWRLKVSAPQRASCDSL
eukprot:5019991-Alexandrium_andersonii.AAC.1